MRQSPCANAVNPFQANNLHQTQRVNEVHPFHQANNLHQIKSQSGQHGQ